MNGMSLDISADNRAQLKQLFPSVFTETKNHKGELVESIDFEKLKAEIGTFSDLFESRRERYGMDWPGKKDALHVVQAPSSATLKPNRDESLNFDKTENLFIEGDNLEVLKLLQKSYHGKVKMIYIDPPYNTGKEFIYPDNFNESLETYLEYTGMSDADGKRFSTNTANEGRFHTKWLNMMYPRLYLSRNLLQDDGVIFISIDEVEFSNLKNLCNDIFGEENFAGEIVWKNGSKNDQDYISVQHEYILCYVKNKNTNKGLWKERKEGLDEIYKAFSLFKSKRGENWQAIHDDAVAWFKQFPESNPIFESKHYTWMDQKGVYFPDNISGPNVGQYVYEIKHPLTKKNVKAPARGWFCPKETLLDLIANNKVHFGPDESTVPCLKTYLKDTEYKSLSSLVFQDGRGASKRLTALFDGKNVFNNPKDENIILRLIKALSLKSDDIILDFFSGSGTTAHAVINYNVHSGFNCHFIMVQLPENIYLLRRNATGLSKKIIENAIDFLNAHSLPKTISEIGKERIRRVIMGKLATLSDQKLDEVDLGFKVLKLSKSNFKQWEKLDPTSSLEKIEQQLQLHVDHVDHNATQEDLLYEILLKAGFMPTEKTELKSIAGKQVFSIADGGLLICLEDEVTKELINKVAELEPMQFICLDSAFNGNDQLKANTVQTFSARNQGRETANQIEFKTI